MIFKKGITIMDSSSWQVFFQNPATPVMEGIIYLHNYIFMYLILVVVVVVWFLVRSLYLFNVNVNKTLTEFTHDSVLESVWTIAPAFILVLITIPSFSLLYSMDDVIDPYITVKAIGHQWYWSYEIDAYGHDDLSEYLGYGFYIMNDQNFMLVVNKHFGLSGEDSVVPTIVKKLIYFRLFIDYINSEEGRYQMWKNRLPPGSKITQLATDDLLPRTEYLMPDVINDRRLIEALDRFEMEVEIKLFELFTTKYMFKYLESKTAASKPKEFFEISEVTVPKVYLRQSSINFDSYMLAEDSLSINDIRLLSVDNMLVLPIRTHIRLLVTSTDVIHSWSVPSFGVKVDAIPGRLNQTALYINQPGVFYGQCSELCGVNHGFMPISVRGVTSDDFYQYVIDYNDVRNRTKSISDCLVKNNNKFDIFIGSN
jgi:heme/copper-type cytochrome/quinol oxidase subunit 2